MTSGDGGTSATRECDWQIAARLRWPGAVSHSTQCKIGRWDRAIPDGFLWL